MLWIVHLFPRAVFSALMLLLVWACWRAWRTGKVIRWWLLTCYIFAIALVGVLVRLYTVGRLSTGAPKNMLHESAMLAFLVLVGPWVAFAISGRRRDAALCSNCQYDLTANTSGRCPECGEAVPDTVLTEARASDDRS